MKLEVGITIAFCIAAWSCTKKEEAQRTEAPRKVPPLEDAMLEVSDRMPDARRRVDVAAELALAHAEVGSTARSSELLTRAASLASAMPAAEDREAGLLRVAAAHEKLGDLVRAYELTGQLPITERTAEARAELAYAFTRGGQEDRGQTVVEALGRTRYGDLAKAQVVRAWAELGRVKEALEVAKSMGAASARNAALLAVSEAHARSGRLKDAQKAAEWMDAGIERSQAYSAIALAAHSVGNVRLSSLMRDRVESALLRATTLARMGEIAETKNNPSAARTLLAKAIKEAEGATNGAMVDAALEAVAMTYADLDRFERAKEVAARTKNPEVITKVLARATANAALAGRLDEAKALAPKLEGSPVWAAQGLDPLAVALARGGRISEALEAALTIFHLELRIPPLARIAVLACRRCQPADSGPCREGFGAECLPAEPAWLSLMEKGLELGATPQ